MPMLAPRRWCNHVPTMVASARRTISVTTTAFVMGALALLAGCDRSSPRAAARRGARRAAANESAYHPAPAVDGVTREDGRVVLSGRAQPGAPVRLATPDGRLVAVVASREGRWRIVLPPSPDMRLYSLSMIDGGRIVQSEGYLAVAPDLTAQLRSGAGAAIYGAQAWSPRITAVDYDSKGGCVVSGVAAAGQAVTILIDGVDRGEVRADATGRFSLPLDEPIGAGPHRLDLMTGGQRASVSVAVTPAGAMPAIPLKAARTGYGWRVDWTTPGGGVQTTVLFAPTGAPA
jgi:hypothetical protein